MCRSIVVALLAVSVARAELPSPRLDRIFPLGASAGTTVEVEIQGADLEGVKRLISDHPGVVATHVADRKFKVSVAADAPEGTRDIWAVGPWGISSPRVFTISRGLAEIVKAKANNEWSKAQELQVNTAVSGQTDGNRQDFYRFKATAGRRLVVEVRAQSIDSSLDATLTIIDAAGKSVAFNSDHDGRDPLIAFDPPSDGDFGIVVADLAYGGGLPYRLILTDKPRIENVFPRALRAGKATELSAIGWNLGKAAAGNSPSGTALEESRESVTAPPEILERGAYRFINHPTAHSVLPTAATGSLTGFQARLSPGGVVANPVPVLVTGNDVTLEKEPNDDPASPQEIALPAVVCGRFDREGDGDWYGFKPQKDGEYLVQVHCERIAGRADPFAVVMDDKDNRVVELDDFGPRLKAYDGHIRDPQGTVRLSAGKTYRLLVRDRYRRGGPRFQYVLEVRPVAPDVHAIAIHHHNPGPGGTSIHRGGAQHLDLVIQHTGGVTGPVKVVAENLPKGLHAAVTSIPSDTSGVFTIWADPDAPEYCGPIRLTAIVTGPEGERRREVRAYTRIDSQANRSSSRPMRELMVSVLPEKPPFSLRFATENLRVEAGSKATVEMIAERSWADFKGPITVNGLSLPNPVKLAQASIAEGKSSVSLAIEVQANAKPGDYTICASGQAQVPFTKDPMKPKANTLVTLPSRPITIMVTEKPKK